MWTVVGWIIGWLVVGSVTTQLATQLDPRMRQFTTLVILAWPLAWLCGVCRLAMIMTALISRAVVYVFRSLLGAINSHD